MLRSRDWQGQWSSLSWPRYRERWVGRGRVDTVWFCEVPAVCVAEETAAVDTPNRGFGVCESILIQRWLWHSTHLCHFLCSHLLRCIFFFFFEKHSDIVVRATAVAAQPTQQTLTLCVCVWDTERARSVHALTKPHTADVGRTVNSAQKYSTTLSF